MPDGRKNNGGHKTAGRKPKLDEFKKIEAMDSIAKPAEAWARVWDLAENAETEGIKLQALKLWIEHRTGKPKETVEQTNTNHNIEIPIIHWIDDETPIDGNNK